MTGTLPEDLILVTEAAAQFPVSRSTIDEWMRGGYIRRFQQGRFRVYVSRGDMERMTRIVEDPPKQKGEGA